MYPWTSSACRSHCTAFPPRSHKPPASVLQKSCNVASVAGLNGQAYCAAYCASKFGVVGLTKALAIEYVKQGLRVNCVCPAGVKTPLMGHFAPPADGDPDLLSRFGLVLKFTHPEEVAEALVYLASDAARFVTGIMLPVDGGTTAR